MHATTSRSILRLLAGLPFVALWSATSQGQFLPQGGKLVGPGALGIANQGTSIAVSGDGSTAILGGPGDSSGGGAAWVFVRSGKAWIQQGRKLQAAAAANGLIGPRLGTSVAISYDGNTVIVGAPGDDGGRGGACVFTRASGAWSQQGEKLLGTLAVDGFIGARQGQSVALSWDGNTAVLGGPFDSLGTGAAWIFTRSGETWSQVGPKIRATTASGEALQGWAVAVSGDGATALIGGIYDFNNAGAAWVFVRSGGTWTQQGYKLYGLDATGGANQGWSVALSYDGNTAIMGAPGDGAGAGAAWLFQRTNGTWSQQGSKIVGTGASGAAGQGTSVALSSDGNTALVGGPGDSAGAGASWVFTRSQGSWTEQGGKIVGPGAAGGDYGAGQGNAVALTADGNVALIGGSTDNGGAGAAWSFTRIAATWGADGTKFLGTDARGNASQGTAVAIAANGATALVGGPTDSTGRGAVWVFARTGKAWGPGRKLVPDTALPASGSSVALSGDGATIVAGAPLDEGGAGAAYVFSLSDSLWSRERAKLHGSGSIDTAGGARQGSAAALSADGRTLIIGGPGDAGGRGAAWVFGWNGVSWQQQGPKLLGTGAAGLSHQGASVALSGDGNTAFVGGPSDSGGAGAVWAFVQSQGIWSQAGGKLTCAGRTGASAFGSGLAVSADGTTLVAGGPSDNGGTGTACVFTRAGEGWIQAGAKLVPADGDPSSAFGAAVSCDGGGSTVVVGGPSDDGGTGAIWVFVRAGDAWVQSGGKILCADPSGYPQSGTSVALSADGGTFIAGGPADNSGAGAAWVFARPPASVAGGSSAPGRFALEQNYPNPFNPATTIRFTLPAVSDVSLDVFAITGQRVARLLEGRLGGGEHAVPFDGTGLASGVYIVRLAVPGRAIAEKLLLVR